MYDVWKSALAEIEQKVRVKYGLIENAEESSVQAEKAPKGTK